MSVTSMIASTLAGIMTSLASDLSDLTKSRALINYSGAETLPIVPSLAV